MNNDDIDKWLNKHITFLSIPGEDVLEYLNNKVSSDTTDDPQFLTQFGDYIKVDGEVITTEKYMEKRHEEEQ